MTRRVFFSFKYSDVFRANVVRNSWVTQNREAAGFIDAAEFESIKKQGDAAIRAWIDNQLNGTSVTVVLIGAETDKSRWVQYEIEKSLQDDKGIIGIDISGIKDAKSRQTSYCCGELVTPLYSWISDNGYQNMGDWIEKAALLVDR